MTEPRLGWRKDPFDDRDYLHKMKLVKLPDMVNHADWLAPVRRQAHNDCVGFGVGMNLCAKAKSLGAFIEWYSPTWIYNGARYLEGTLAQDAGAVPSDALKWLLKSGCLLEQFWPYNPDTLDMSAPSSERQAQANKYAGFAYYRVTDGVSGIQSALADGHLVSIGQPWPQKWMSIPQTGEMPEVTEADQVLGGHETCLYGYNAQKAIFYGVNSWGTEWGYQGHYSMPFSSIDTFKKLGGYDAHYITFTAEPAPSGPSPSPCKVGNGVAAALNIYSRTFGRKGRFQYVNP